MSVKEVSMNTILFNIILNQRNLKRMFEQNVNLNFI